MGFTIDAWIDNGEPRLQVLDLDSNTVRLAWRASDARTDASLQKLFKELMLLSLVQQLHGATPRQDGQPPLSEISARTDTRSTAR